MVEMQEVVAKTQSWRRPDLPASSGLGYLAELTGKVKWQGKQ
jgi:hypothetical protein